MRQIKFRAWHETEKKMLHGTNREVFSWAEEGQDIVIEQFTGLKDKNGVDIYENDVCNIYESNAESSKYKTVIYHKSVIRFYGSAFVYGQPIYGGGLANFYLGNIDSDFIEVIGNVHQQN